MSRDFEATLEDIEWLDQDGVGAFDAATRVGFPSASAMEKWLERHDQYPLWLRLKNRDPEGAHHRPEKKAAVTNIDPIISLLDRADEAAKKSFRNRADKIRDLIKSLRADLDAEQREWEAKAEARAEVERLQEELADAKARLTGKPKQVRKASTVLGEAKIIRQWAAENGIPCPAMGRIPAEVREAYEARQDVAS